MYNDIDKNSIDYNYKKNLSLSKYMKQDRYIEIIAMEQADVILTNSIITYNLFRKLYSKFNNKIYHPISLSNITVPTKPIKTKKYDIIFVCYNWKRKVKNSGMVRKLINDERMNKYRILLLGDNYNNILDEKRKNINVSSACDQKTLLNMLGMSKVFIMTSYYDSNPNTLVEATYSGCSVITSKNVGQHIYINDKYIVDDIENKDEWIDKIDYALTHNDYSYNGPDLLDVLTDLKNCINYASNYDDDKKDMFLNKRIGVGIYKIPPLWERDMREYNEFKIVEGMETKKRKFIEETIGYDLFYKLFMILSMELGCDEFHYLTCDDKLKTTIKHDVSKIFPNISNVYIWSIANISDILKFNGAKYYFMRGSYHKFYKHIIDNNKDAISILYRATALLYLKKMEPVTTPYNIIIHDGEEDQLKDIHPFSELLQFYKFADSNFIFYGLKREYDVCFVATHKQMTKNHHLFVELIKYSERQKLELKYVFVGDSTQLKCFDNFDIKKLKYVKLVIIKSLSRERIVQLYNNSRINVLFSGRDCNPRVITESLACGCFNIALDTLSDGGWMYDGVLGELVGSSNIKKLKMKAHSVAYEPSDIIFEKMTRLITKEYDHKQIAIKAGKIFTLERNIVNIMRKIIEIKNHNESYNLVGNFDR